MGEEKARAEKQKESEEAEMRNMLIDLIKGSSQYIWDDAALIERIADHLLANGVIVLPCKVGDTVYRITEYYGGGTAIVEGEAFEFAITHEPTNKDKYRFYFWAKGEELVRRQFSLWCNFADFGKTVFITKEEAEKALERSAK